MPLSRRMLANTIRPMSPHLTIYEPQLTWLMSIGHRLTGAFHSTLIYGLGCSFALASFYGDTALMYTGLVQSVDNVPLPIVYLSKGLLSFPFVYHSLNGVRHLVWDAGYCLSLRGVYATGWMVNALSVLGGTVLALM